MKPIFIDQPDEGVNNQSNNPQSECKEVLELENISIVFLEQIINY